MNSHSITFHSLIPSLIQRHYCSGKDLKNDVKMVSRTWYKGNLFETGVQYPSQHIEQALLQAFITFHILKIAPQLPSHIQLLQPPSDPFFHVHITFAKALQETQCTKN